MQNFIVTAILSLVLFSFGSSQDYDYTLNYGSDGLWSGSYGNNPASGWNLVALIQDEYLGVGDGIVNCEPHFLCNDPADINCDSPYAILPDGQSILICNQHPQQSVHILEGASDITGYFVCQNMPQGGNVVVLGPGQCAIITHTGEIITVHLLAIPTLSQWGLIILGMCLSIFGFVAVRRKIYRPI